MKEKGMNRIRMFRSARGIEDIDAAQGVDPFLKTDEVDVHQIMKSLGHKQLSTTEIYLERVFEKELHAIHLW
ncbi:hypothetical protein SB775_16330 [Peribacillus sp. SIMBA_075]|uniref:hypothetical protein n=1 Tax=Peribacillus sp. SIMBA_075 TaxID=3085813 RepID=UPI00397C3C60